MNRVSKRKNTNSKLTFGVVFGLSKMKHLRGNAYSDKMGKKFLKDHKTHCLMGLVTL